MPPVSASRRRVLAVGGGALWLAACVRPTEPASSLSAPLPTGAPALAASPTATSSPTPATRLRAPLTYVAIGASDTAGVGVDNPEREAWVNVLAADLPQPVTVVNLGISGATAEDAVHQELPDALAHLAGQRGLGTVWLVVNDILAGVPLERYGNALAQFLDSLRAAGAEVAVGNAPDPPAGMDYLQAPGVTPAQRRQVVMAWNAVIASEAERSGAVLVDVFGRWPLAAHREYIGPDHFHPSAAGYRALAQVFRQTLAERRVV